MDFGLIKQTLNRTSRCIKVDADFMLHIGADLLLPKGQRCVLGHPVSQGQRCVLGHPASPEKSTSSNPSSFPWFYQASQLTFEANWSIILEF